MDSGRKYRDKSVLDEVGRAHEFAYTAALQRIKVSPDCVCSASASGCPACVVNHDLPTSSFEHSFCQAKSAWDEASDELAGALRYESHEPSLSQRQWGCMSASCPARVGTDYCFACNPSFACRTLDMNMMYRSRALGGPHTGSSRFSCFWASSLASVEASALAGQPSQQKRSSQHNMSPLTR